MKEYMINILIISNTKKIFNKLLNIINAWLIIIIKKKK